MKTEQVLVTPKQALEWLTKIDQKKQRKFNQRSADQYAAILRTGHWVLTHQGIAFDEAGNLCDGQHRLWAIAHTGISALLLVTTGIPVQQGQCFTFDAIDRGRNRTIGDQLHVRHGVENANRMASAARTIAEICVRSTVKMTVPTSMIILDKFRVSIELAEECLKASKIAKLRKAALVGSLAFCHRVMPVELEKFVKQVGDGVDLKPNSPALMLRNYVLNSSSIMGFLVYERVTTVCAMRYVLQEQVRLLKISSIGLDFFTDKQPQVVNDIRALFVAPGAARVKEINMAQGYNNPK